MVYKGLYGLKKGWPIESQRFGELFRRSIKVVRLGVSGLERYLKGFGLKTGFIGQRPAYSKPAFSSTWYGM